MENKGKYTESQVVSDLKRKADISIHGKQIQELTREHSRGDVGIKSRGKIRFLTDYCSYVHIYVTKHS